ncbi:MAG: dockerin type I repeat-containing protein [Clostridia bacterium]|nr:dockerin type I repeat-containing protein [Clostridia bacterium]
MKKVLAALLSVLLLATMLPMSAVNVAATTVTLEEMRARAEAMVNYEWIPSQDIAVWNENPYNGKMYFPQGETVRGIPYTLFTSEVVSWSLCSLAQYDRVATTNYSTTAFCASVNAVRTGPVYGSCCADFVSEVFGGDFMYGEAPRYCNVGSIQRSPYGTTTYGVKACDIEAGDALSNTKGSHIVWVGEVTETHFVIYEQTPPVARKVTVSKESVNADGFLVYGDLIYSIVTRNNAYVGEPENPNLIEDDAYDIVTEFKAYPCVANNFEVKRSDLTTRYGEIYTTDYCTIHKVYTNGWCQVTFPLDSGGTRTAYTPISNFVSNPNAEFVSFVAKEYIDLYSTSTLSNKTYRIYPDDVCYLVGSVDGATQVFMPMTGKDYYVLGWVSTDELNVPEELGVCGDVNGDGYVNNRDISALQQYLTGWDVVVNESVSDVNDDGRVNNKDLGLLQRYLNGWEVELG